jgi:hypothetical protein
MKAADSVVIVASWQAQLGRFLPATGGLVIAQASIQLVQPDSTIAGKPHRSCRAAWQPGCHCERTRRRFNSLMLAATGGVLVVTTPHLFNADPHVAAASPS